MSGTAIIVGEILVGVIQLIALRAKAAGLSAEEVNKLLEESVAKVRATKPEDLPEG